MGAVLRIGEALGLDLDSEAVADLGETKRAWESGDQTAFVPLSEL